MRMENSVEDVGGSWEFLIQIADIAADLLNYWKSLKLNVKVNLNTNQHSWKSYFGSRGKTV